MPRRYEDVRDLLIHALAEGRFAAGEWLPSEQRLAEQFGSGRGALREAVLALELRGIVDVVPGHGQRVLSTDRWDLHDADVLLALVQHGRMRGVVREAIAARATAEREAAALASQHATAGDLGLMRDRLDEMDRATALEERGSERDDPFVKGEAWFHHTLVLLSRNRVLAAMTEPLHLALAAIRHRHARDREGAALTHHRRILEGVSSREAELAASAVDGYARQLSRWLPD
jgi:GntR family transcriptional regulator, transcriptional repressor for pyruvate dehydrogenase complex